MQVVVMAPDCGYVRVALYEVNELSEVFTLFIVFSLESFDLFALPRIFLFERVNLTFEC